MYDVMRTDRMMWFHIPHRATGVKKVGPPPPRSRSLRQLPDGVRTDRVRSEGES